LPFTSFTKPIRIPDKDLIQTMTRENRRDSKKRRICKKIILEAIYFLRKSKTNPLFRLQMKKNNNRRPKLNN
jgi:hypothetical protein